MLIYYIAEIAHPKCGARDLNRMNDLMYTDVIC